MKIVEVAEKTENRMKEERDYIEMIPNINIERIKEVEMHEDYFAQTKYSKQAITDIYRD